MVNNKCLFTTYKAGVGTHPNPALGQLRQNCSEFQGQSNLQKMRPLPPGKKKDVARTVINGTQHAYHLCMYNV